MNFFSKLLILWRHQRTATMALTKLKWFDIIQYNCQKFHFAEVKLTVQKHVWRVKTEIVTHSVTVLADNLLRVYLFINFIFLVWQPKSNFLCIFKLHPDRFVDGLSRRKPHETPSESNLNRTQSPLPIGFSQPSVNLVSQNRISNLPFVLLPVWHNNYVYQSDRTLWWMQFSRENLFI